MLSGDGPDLGGLGSTVCVLSGRPVGAVSNRGGGSVQRCVGDRNISFVLNFCVRALQKGSFGVD